VSNFLVRLPIAPVIFFTMLTGCQLKDFDVTPCSANGRIAFRIHEISSWLRDYQPRPGLILVHAWEPGPAAWSVRRNSLEERPARKVILYGQHLPGWEVEQRPHVLRPGLKYHIYITDGGHAGNADFVADEPLPEC
jgi:hypothetical protein